MTRPIDRGSVGRAVIDRQTLHVHDMQQFRDETEFLSWTSYK